MTCLFPRTTAIHSPISGEIFITEFLGRKSLFVNGTAQSGGEFKRMWDQVISKIKNRNFRQCAVLGVGGGTVIRSIRRYYPDLPITAIEIDPLIISLAADRFGLKNIRYLNLVVFDALDWVKRNINLNRYDLIVVDLFTGRTNPLPVRQQLFLKRLIKTVRNGGTVLYNAHFTPGRLQEYNEFIQLLQSIFKNPQQVFAYKYNRVIRMTKADRDSSLTGKIK